jgi:hypothetical protein
MGILDILSIIAILLFLIPTFILNPYIGCYLLGTMIILLVIAAARKNGGDE